jgi:glutathione S-transferase
MFLIGQYDSPFVRRTAIALRLYGLPFEHRPWSTFGDADKIAPYNPLLRVPVLVLDDGEALIDSAAILDHLDETVGPARGDKAVSLIYERVLRKDRLALWVARCETQISGVLSMLEVERAGVTTDYWYGEHIGHADIAVACVLRFTSEAHPHLFDETRYPALAAHAATCEALPAFQDIVQPLAPPSGD